LFFTATMGFPIAGNLYQNDVVGGRR